MSCVNKFTQDEELQDQASCLRNTVVHLHHDNSNQRGVVEPALFSPQSLYVVWRSLRPSCGPVITIRFYQWDQNQLGFHAYYFEIEDVKE